MSTIRPEIFENYRYAEARPQWMDAERIDYCEQSGDSRKTRSRFATFVNLFLSIF